MAATRPVTGATEMAEAAFERAIDARRDDAYAARGRVRRILRHIGTFLVPRSLDTSTPFDASKDRS